MTNPMRELWQQVVLLALLDAGTKSASSSLDRHQADRWLRSGGADFALVCNLAGFDPAFVRDNYVAGRINLRALRSKALATEGRT